MQFKKFVSVYYIFKFFFFIKQYCYNLKDLNDSVVLALKLNKLNKTEQMNLFFCII